MSAATIAEEVIELLEGTSNKVISTETLLASAVSLVAIAVTVRGSAKAQTIEEAQQRAVFLIFPILALVIGQFSGVILVNSGLLLGLGIVLAVLAVLLMRGAARNFTYEKLLK